MNKLKHLALCVIFTVPILLLSACDQNSKTPDITSPAPSNTFEPIVVSTPSEGSPQPSATYEPAPEYNATDVTIAILSGGWSDAQISSVNKLTKYLHRANWNIRFSLVTNPPDIENPTAVTYFKANTDSGGRLYDAYIIDACQSKSLSADEFLMDLTKRLPETAPVYYSKYKKLFEDKIYALPTHIKNQQRWNQTAFFCTNLEYGAQKDCQNISDVLALLESDATKSKKIIYRFVTDDFINPWTFEQGYYPLSDYGMYGGVFAAYGDNNCTPVLLENIPGFADFAARCRALLSTHQLIRTLEAYEVKGNPAKVSFLISKEELLGFIRWIDGESELFPISSFERNTVAYPISGGRPRLPSDDPDYRQEIIIPANSTRAADVIKFVEWVFLNSQNYDLVNYGELGVDYQLVNDRYEPLINGAQVPMDHWWGSSESMVYVDSFDSPFFNYQYARYTTNAPINMEMVKDKYQDMLPPIWSIERFHKDQNYPQALKDLGNNSGFSTLITSRSALLERMFDPGTEPISTLMTRLSVLDNAQILENYTIIIKSLEDGE